MKVPSTQQSLKPRGCYCYCPVFLLGSCEWLASKWFHPIQIKHGVNLQKIWCIVVDWYYIMNSCGVVGPNFALDWGRLPLKLLQAHRLVANLVEAPYSFPKDTSTAHHHLEFLLFQKKVDNKRWFWFLRTATVLIIHLPCVYSFLCPHRWEPRRQPGHLASARVSTAWRVHPAISAHGCFHAFRICASGFPRSRECWQHVPTREDR